MCTCYSRRTHYPTLEKPGAQNVAACEKQGKQRELSDHWKSVSNPKKTKRLTGIQVLIKDFTSHKIKSLSEKSNVVS